MWDSGAWLQPTANRLCRLSHSSPAPGLLEGAGVDQRGKASEWSSPARVEHGAVGPEDWQG